MTDIGLFILLVLPRDTAMDGEIQCFCHMFTVIQIFRRCNPTDLPRLKREIAQHHLLYIIVFPRCLKNIDVTVSCKSGEPDGED